MISKQVVRRDLQLHMNRKCNYIPHAIWALKTRKPQLNSSAILQLNEMRIVPTFERPVNTTSKSANDFSEEMLPSIMSPSVNTNLHPSQDMMAVKECISTRYIIWIQQCCKSVDVKTPWQLKWLPCFENRDNGCRNFHKFHYPKNWA